MPEVQTISGQGCVKGSKLLRSVNAAEGGSIDAKVGLPKTALIGIPKEPSQFLTVACKLVHPTTMALSVGDMLVRNILSYNDPSGLCFRWCGIFFFTMVPAAFVSEGSNVSLQTSLFLCALVAHDESMRREQMDGHVRKVLASERVMLFRGLLDDLEYPDSKVALEMRQGFSLSGWPPSSNSSLGWKLSEDPEKDKPFSTVFQALDVEFDLELVP